jgi:Domain of unknown function DUF29
MIEQATAPLATLYEQDETAWLEQTANLVAERRFEDIDLPHLSEYLSDMARRDRREVVSRLRTLLTHLLKWDYQPEKRGRSWQATIHTQRRDLGDLLDSGTLRRHAEEVLTEAYRDAVEQAAIETGLPETTFPASCSMSLDEALTRELEQ